MSERKLIPGKFAWFEHVSSDARKAQAFFGEVFGWTVEPFPMGTSAYEMISAGGTAIGGYPPLADDRPPHWISYVSVEDVDATAKAVAANGGRVVAPPADVPGVGRMARVADPQGAGLCVFRSSQGDPADGPVPHGGWVWNELHTSDPAKALSFYERALGYAHRSMDVGPGGTYYILSRSGADRGGVTGHLPAGVRPHWLPYVHVADADETIARARKLGATILRGPEDVPTVGRIAALQDPMGAAIAIIKPMPRQG